MFCIALAISSLDAACSSETAARSCVAMDIRERASIILPIVSRVSSARTLESFDAFAPCSDDVTTLSRSFVIPAI